jgi:hypothetical protein
LVERKIHPPRTRLKTFDKSAGIHRDPAPDRTAWKYVGAADTDDLPRWLVAWVRFNPQSRNPIGAVTECARSIGRELFTTAKAQAILEEAAVTPRQMKADNLAKWLGVTYVDRQQLGLTRIGAVNIGKRARRVLRKRRDRLAKERKRRDRGVKPRAEYEANSSSKSKPWWQLGLSRATWYRLGKSPLAVMKQVRLQQSSLDVSKQVSQRVERKRSFKGGLSPSLYLVLLNSLSRGARSSPRRLSLHINQSAGNFGAFFGISLAGTSGRWPSVARSSISSRGGQSGRLAMVRSVVC